MLQFDVYSWLPDDPPVCISPGDGAYLQSCIQPQGGHALFWGGAKGPPRIWRADLDGNECIPITAGQSGARQPSYSMDGKRTVFVSDGGVKQSPETVETIFRENATGPMRRDLILHIFTMNPDGSDVRQITDGPVQDLRPSFSPDGKTICFFSIRGGRAGLWLVAADGKSRPYKIKADVTLYRPVWSLDGKRIYGFYILSNERHQVGWIDPVNGKWTALENDNAGQTRSPVPDPTQDALLAHSNHDGIWRICEIPLDGKTPMRFLFPKGFENATCVHPSRAVNGVMTFGSTSMETVLRFGSGYASHNY